MKTKRIWTVMWTHEADGTCVAGVEGAIIGRFAKEVDARRYAIGRRHYSEAADVMAEDVPAKIARRWGF